MGDHQHQRSNNDKSKSSSMLIDKPTKVWTTNNCNNVRNSEKGRCNLGRVQIPSILHNITSNSVKSQHSTIEKHTGHKQNPDRRLKFQHTLQLRRGGRLIFLNSVSTIKIQRSSTNTGAHGQYTSPHTSPNRHRNTNRSQFRSNNKIDRRPNTRTGHHNTKPKSQHPLGGPTSAEGVLSDSERLTSQTEDKPSSDSQPVLPGLNTKSKNCLSCQHKRTKKNSSKTNTSDSINNKPSKKSQNHIRVGIHRVEQQILLLVVCLRAKPQAKLFVDRSRGIKTPIRPKSDKANTHQNQPRKDSSLLLVFLSKISLFNPISIVLIDTILLPLSHL
mmetsp:Transcript_11494/g.17391  ORF Transcript_11494/g.17391 Transcript_11494/m.17391 type:complete len:330 (-) Transcript_11494:49-1038(-)